MNTQLVEKAARDIAADISVTEGSRLSARFEVASAPREKILHTAARLFHERGYRGTTVREVGDAVGILSGSLFHHFRSKEEMLLEIMRETAFFMCTHAEAVVRHLPTPKERLQELIDFEFEWMVTDIKKDYLAILVFEWRELADAIKPEFTRLQKRYNAVWVDVLSDLERAGELRIPADAAARILHGSSMWAMTWFDQSGKYSAREFRDMLMTLVQR